MHKDSAKLWLKLVSNFFQGVKRRHDHIGNKENYTWSKEECLEEVSKYEVGDIINYSDLARRYQLKNKNGSAFSVLFCNLT